MDTVPVYTPTVNSPKDNKHTDSLIPISVNTVNKPARIITINLSPNVLLGAWGVSLLKWWQRSRPPPRCQRFSDQTLSIHPFFSESQIQTEGVGGVGGGCDVLEKWGGKRREETRRRVKNTQTEDNDRSDKKGKTRNAEERRVPTVALMWKWKKKKKIPWLLRDFPPWCQGAFIYSLLVR